MEKTESKIIKDINAFKALDLKNETIENVFRMFQSIYTLSILKVANIGDRNVYRIRRLESDASFKEIENLWCPKSEDVMKLGRANNINESIFYGALDHYTAMYETNIQGGERFAIAIYRLSKNQGDEKSSVIIDKTYRNVFKKKDANELSKILSELMVDEFTKVIREENRWEYLKSVAIAKVLFSLPGKDSLLYPSTKRKDRINVAMKEASARKRLALQSIIECILDKETSNIFVTRYFDNYEKLSSGPIEYIDVLPNTKFNVKSNGEDYTGESFKKLLANKRLPDRASRLIGRHSSR